ncbi:MAG: hypothetical protein M1818_006651 [Claussenomyces sp. TS43310]|nr:MAG: hypothetical protein M1818_006916 [Claussenomyces sp. TS43310]KAI9735074.1 MAG: hypothetical protein M1818_006651 [Claussenomyces sp. TS43310]
MVSLTTYGGWAGLFLVAGGYWYLQNERRRNKQQKVRSAISHTSRSNESRKTGVKAKKEGTDAGQSSADQANTSQDGRKKNKKKQKVKGSADAELSQTSYAESGANRIDVDTFDDGMDNREFARQLQSAKSGTIMASRPHAGLRQKSVKQSKMADATESTEKVNGPKVPFDDSAPSSTAGADGDDDLSAANSPNLAATKSNGGIDPSDMLEQPTTGPSVLRITESSDQLPVNRQHKAPTQVTMETKKQRQNRKKAEERKAAREEDEKARRTLMERQRRTAREAEGRAAKDGSSFTAAKTPVSSVWNASPAAVDDDAGSPVDKVELLDTYDPTSSNLSNVTESAVVDAARSKGHWAGDMPSEEEQMRLLKEESEWATVGSKKGRKNTKSRQLDTHPADKSASANGEGLKPSTEPVIEVQRSGSDTPTLSRSDRDQETSEPEVIHKKPRTHEVEVEYNVGTTKISETKYLQDSEWDV